MEQQSQQSIEQNEKIHPHITTCQGLFIGGFFCPIIWLVSLHYRNSPDKTAQKWKRASLTAFTILSLVIFCIFWLLCIIVFSLDQVLLPLQQFASDYQVQFPADLMALFYAILFMILVLTEVIRNCIPVKKNS